MITITLNPVKAYISGEVPNGTYKKIEMKLSYRCQNAEYMPSFKKGEWDGRIRLFDFNDLSFPTGLLSQFIELIDSLNISYNIIDDRPKSVKHFQWEWVSDKILRDYQKDAIEQISIEKIGMIQIATGGGKTLIMSKTIQELGRKTLILVHKLDLLEQAKGVIESSLGVEVGRIGDGEVTIKDITIGTVQTIVKAFGWKFQKFMDEEIEKEAPIKEVQKEELRHLVRTVEVIFIDESHHVRSDTQQKILSNAEIADFRIGLSATPMREQGDDMLIEGVFGKVLCKISATWLIRHRYLVPPEINFNNISYTVCDFYELVVIDKSNNITYCSEIKKNKKGRKLKYNIESILQRHIFVLNDTEDSDIVYEFLDGSRVAKKKIHYEGESGALTSVYEKLEESCKNIFDAFIQDQSVRQNKLFNNKDVIKLKRKNPDLIMKQKYNFFYDTCITYNEYRNMYIVQLINMHLMEGRAVLVLIRILKHGDNLVKLLGEDTIFLKGEDDVKVRTKELERIRKGDLKLLIASTIADEGLDLPAIDSLIMAGAGVSRTAALQRVGRALRICDEKGKEKAYVEEFYDCARYLYEHAKSRIDIYSTEPAFIIRHSNA